MMTAQGINSSAISEIIELKNGQHFQIACRKYFEVTHPGCKNDIVISHPNQYFDESEKYYAAQNGVDPGQPAPVISNTNYTNPTNEPKAAPVL
jgi:DNA primase large subunit